VAFDLAQMAVHDRAASQAFGGPDFYQVLTWIHASLRPATYVEIGVHSGCSLAAVNVDTLALCIDPDPLLKTHTLSGSRFFRLTSTDFFRNHDLRAELGGNPVDFALIDGLHLFEQVLEDFCNLERFMSDGGIIAIHDTVPLNRETSTRERTTEFYTGDVWKIVPFLRRHRPDVDMVTVATAPSGLTLLRGLDAQYNHSQLFTLVENFAVLEFEYFEAHRGEFLRTIPNHPRVVQDFCQKMPVQSMPESESVMHSRRR
jgi:hypothetical protein